MPPLTWLKANSNTRSIFPIFSKSVHAIESNRSVVGKLSPTELVIFLWPRFEGKKFRFLESISGKNDSLKQVSSVPVVLGNWQILRIQTNSSLKNLSKIYLKHLEHDPEYRHKAIYRKLALECRSNLAAELGIFGLFQEKIGLKGSTKDKLEQLDNRETELLHLVGQLNKEIEIMKSRPNSSRPGSARQSRTSINEKDQLRVSNEMSC